MKTTKLARTTITVLLLISIFGCSNSKYKTTTINGEEFIIYEDIQYPSVFGEPILSDEEYANLDDEDAEDYIRTYIDYVRYTKDMSFENNAQRVEQTYHLLANDYDEIGIAKSVNFSLMYIKTNGKYYPVDPKHYDKEWLINYNLQKYSFDTAKEMCKALQGKTAFAVETEVLAKGVVEKKIYDWKVDDLEADSLETIELTIDEILDKSNKRKKDIFENRPEATYSETSRKDALALSAYDAGRIKVVSDEFDSTYKSIELSVDEAKEDAQIYADMIQSSYGPYHDYDASVWEDALSNSLNRIDELNKETISGEELADIFFDVYSFVKDDHFRIGGESIIEHCNGIYYYYYCKEFEFFKDARGYFAYRKDRKWYLSSINGDSDVESYLKPTITSSGRLGYQIGTLMNLGNDLNLTLSLTRGDSEIIYETAYIKSKTLRDMGFNEKSSQSGIYDGYYVLGIRGAGSRNGDEINRFNKYATQGSYLRNESNFIIDSRANTGGNMLPYVTSFNKNLSGSYFEYDISERFRYSLLTYRNISNMESSINDSVVVNYNGTYYNNENLFAYLIDKNVGSSGERATHAALQMDNVLLIGTNTRGCMTGSYQCYYLPNSKMTVTMGPSSCVNGDVGYDIEGVGWLPDIYVDGYLALDRTIKMYKYYGLTPSSDVKTYESWGSEIPMFEN